MLPVCSRNPASGLELRRLCARSVVLMLVLSCAPGASALAPEPQQLVSDVIARVLARLNEAPVTDDGEAEAAVLALFEQELSPYLAFDTITRWVAGKSWNGLEQAQQAEQQGDAEPRQPQKEALEGDHHIEQQGATMACAGCHILDQPQTEDNRGPVGPNMGNLAENAAARVEGMLPEDYVHESIVNPNAYVVEGYSPGVMLQTFAQQMTEEEIEGLVEWLLDPDR